MLELKAFKASVEGTRMMEAGREEWERDAEGANGLPQMGCHQARSLRFHVFHRPLALGAILLVAGLTALLFINSSFHSEQPKTVRLHQVMLSARQRTLVEWSAGVPMWNNQVWPLFIGYTWGWTMLQQV
jgi:hypothetical protein